MTGLLNEFRPSWLDEVDQVEADPLAGCELHLALYESAWDAGKIVVTANCLGQEWSGILALPDLESCLNDASQGLDSDIEIAGQSIPVHLNGEYVPVQLGPFLALGTAADWKTLLDRTRSDAQPLSQCPAVTTRLWAKEPIPLPVTSID